MRRGTPRRSEQNQSLDEEIGKIPEQLLLILHQLRGAIQIKSQA
jgi:hypothetical protein